MAVLVALLVYLFIPLDALAAPAYSSIISFGDSLSDIGRVDGGYGIANSTNGNVWMEYLADQDHLNCPLYDYACGGATTGYDNPAGGRLSADYSRTGVLAQVDLYLSSHNYQVPHDALITLWAGWNDLLNIQPGDNQERAVHKAVSNLGTAMKRLNDAGAGSILVLNLLDLGATPKYNGDSGSSGKAHSLAKAFNDFLAGELPGLKDELPDLNVYPLDAYGMLQEVRRDPENFGFDDVTDQLISSVSTTGTYLFWDEIHPTTRFHELIANCAYAALNSDPQVFEQGDNDPSAIPLPEPVPEPGMSILIGAGLLVLTWIGKKEQDGN
jgi:phospholipase/lecithinase/hemolysin